ncbi:NrfD/PsrC family molybdoenzyme membrane anchor subunit [Vibrio paucivorans]|uniref:Polysulfide reductase NrfD n=1 Tax=Vibrio paucivorans TaxID=2829489 RepID=A0A9X3CGI1_9VIBR|nr:NrfD/PsrC family molybdoenzyme membrane anchor subunit [Vibrio paucivorans]MCW8335280.1 polysulfide reductase NrfD [Vibrio paucivorans]
MSITEVLIQPQAIVWLPWAVQYFFYIGSAYAAAILFLVTLIYDTRFTHQLRAALALTMAIGAIVGPLALTGDLHQPGRAWHFYAHFTPWSWMSLGSLFLPAFSGLAVTTAWLYLRQDLHTLSSHSNPVLRWISVLTLGNWNVSRKALIAISSLTVISGLSIALYTGAEIAIVESRPLWNQAASPLIWFTTAFLGAIGFSLLIWVLFPTGHNAKHLSDADTKLVKNTALLSSISALILVPIWASNHSAFCLFYDDHWVKNIAAMSLSLLTCALAVLFFMRGQARLGGILVISIATLSTTWLTRWITMMEVQTLPKYDVGPYPYSLPLDNSGLLGIIGMLGLWLALAMFASELIKRDDETSLSTTTDSQ